MIPFIADIGSNHNQSLTRAKNLILAAKESGCWGVKFQLFKAEQLWRDKTVAGRMKHWELPEEFIPELSSFCKALDIAFGCTPFYLKAVDILKDHVDFLKVGSYELLWLDLIRKCAKTDKKLILSTGMGSFVEILNAMSAAIVHCKSGCNDDDNVLGSISVLHCNSTYPANLEDCNMAQIEVLRNQFRRSVGWSDHTTEPGVIYSAISYGASIIEFHLDLEDKQGVESRSGHCWKPSKIECVINNISNWLKTEYFSKTSLTQKIEELRKSRTDPTDGMRPLKNVKST